MEGKELRIEVNRTDQYNLYPLGDIHLGSSHCSESAIERKVAAIKSERNALWIGMGDYMECILPSDKRFDIGGLAKWVVKDNITESQRERTVKLLKPIANKCIGLLTGNHEETLHMRGEGDVTRNLCKDLNVDYLSYAAMVRLIFNRSGSQHSFLVHAWHGAGAAQSEGGRLMRLMRLVNEVQADIYLMGHLHAITTHTPERLTFGRRVEHKRLVAATTGSWMTTYTQPKSGEHMNSGYGERAGYKPSSIGCPVVHIWPSHGTFTVEA